MAQGRSQGAAHGLPAVRPGGHRQDLPGRVPRRRGRRAGGQAQEFPRSLGGLERGQPGEDLPPGARARPLHGVHRRGRPDAGQTRFGQRRLGTLGTHLLDDRAGDVGQRQPRPRAVAARLLAPRPHRGRPQTSGPRRRQSTVVTDQHHHRERAAHRPAREALRPRAHARGSDAARAAHAHAAHARRRRGAGGQGVSSLAHPECSRRRGSRSQSRRLPEPGAGRRAGIPDAHRGARGDGSQLRAAGVPRARLAS